MHLTIYLYNFYVKSIDIFYSIFYKNVYTRYILSYFYKKITSLHFVRITDNLMYAYNKVTYFYLNIVFYLPSVHLHSL